MFWVAEARSLLAVQERTGVIIAEGFMVHGHPQWLRARDLIAEGQTLVTLSTPSPFVLTFRRTRSFLEIEYKL